MSTIINNLRDWDMPYLAHQAADEIEQLEREIAVLRVRDVAKTIIYQVMHREIDNLWHDVSKDVYEQHLPEYRRVVKLEKEND